MRAIVIGGARSGIGVAKLLHQQGYEVILTTNKDFSERVYLENLGIRVSLNDKDLSLVSDYDVVVKNPGIPMSHPLVSQFDTVLNEIEIAYRVAKNYNFYAVSGTNGKTTTTTMLYEMLKLKDAHALLAGNVGVALSEMVYEQGDYKRDVALEIAAFQMEGTPTFAPEVYGLINLTPDHLDRFETVDDYYQAKLNILPNVGIFVRNIDDPNIARLTTNYEGKCVNVSLVDEKADVHRKNGSIYYNDVKLFDISTLKLVGEHNVLNATIASTIAYLAGVSLESIQEVIETFKSVEHRIEYVTTINDVRFYNDSKGTNPESTDVALKSFDGNIHLLAGGYDKHISFEILRKHTPKLSSIHVFGESADQLKEVFPQAIKVDTMLDATQAAFELAKPGDVILLSPACASYDQFNNFEQRGKIFKDFVNNLNKK